MFSTRSTIHVLLMLRTVLAALILCAAITAAGAQTPAEIAACKPDFKRYCSQFSASQIADCIKDNRNRLSSQCRAVLTAHGL
jgi:hypothetical protein